ncbi:hypothetical protein ACK6D9_00730 [Hoeflea sp. Naph1]|uniref:hypothetical protein n=1 Tax=Hoeflea sp. Naph1 TaxID=3388653 RepID=UPI00398FB699
MNYSKYSEVRKALDFNLEIDGIKYQVKPATSYNSSALYIQYQVLIVKNGDNKSTFAIESISLHDEILDIPDIVERRIRDKLIDDLAPRDCVIPMVWEEALGLVIILNNSGHTAFADKVLDAFRNAKPSTRV